MRRLGEQLVVRDLHGRGAEPRRLDTIAGEGRRQRHLPAAVAQRGRGRREVARQHRGGGDKRQVVGRRLDRPRALIGAEEEEAIPHDRPAERPAELVPVEPVVQPLAVRSDRGERGPGVEAAVAEELEGVPVQAVGARLHDRIDRRGRVHAVVRGQAARRDAELLQRVRERKRQVGVVVGVVVHRTVKGVPDAAAEAAGDGNRDALGDPELGDPAGVDGRAGERDEVGDLAPLQRQLDDPFLLDDLADAGAAHVNQRRGRFHRHGLLEVADGERRVERRRRADLQHDAGLDVGAEALQRHFEPIGADRHVRHQPGAGLVGDGGTRERGIGLRRRHGDAGQDAAALVGDATVNLCRALRRGGAGDEQKDDEND